MKEISKNEMIEMDLGKFPNNENWIYRIFAIPRSNIKMYWTKERNVVTFLDPLNDWLVMFEKRNAE